MTAVGCTRRRRGARCAPLAAAGSVPPLGRSVEDVLALLDELREIGLPLRGYAVGATAASGKSRSHITGVCSPSPSGPQRRRPG